VRTPALRIVAMLLYVVILLHVTHGQLCSFAREGRYLGQVSTAAAIRWPESACSYGVSC